MANFTDFNYASPNAGDYVVGYKGDGSAEQRTTVNDFLSTGLGYFSLYSPNQGSVSVNEAGQTVDNFSFAQGGANNVIGFWSAALGYNNKVPGSLALAAGGANKVYGETSFAQGDSNITDGQTNQAMGTGNVTAQYSSHAQGFRNFAGGYQTAFNNFGYSNARGAYNIAAVPHSHVEGFGNKSGYALSFDWYGNNPPRIGFGFQGFTSLDQINIYNLNNKALSSSVRLFFVDDTGITNFTAYVSAVSADYVDPSIGVPSFTLFLKNDESAVLPNDDFYGGYIYCMPITAYDGSTNNSNIGAASHAEGYGNIVAGSYAHAEGFGNVAAGLHSHAGGYYSSTGASAIAAQAAGYFCAANGRYSVAMGSRAITPHSHSFIWNGSDNVNNNFQTTASGQYCVNAPGGIYLSGGPTQVQGIEIGDWTRNITNSSNVLVRSSASSGSFLSGGLTLGFLNSAFDGYAGRSRNIGANVGTVINGYANLVDSGMTDVNGGSNYVVADMSNVKGIANAACYYNCSVEGTFNTVGRIYTIVKATSATNEIFFNENISQVPSAPGYMPVGSKILIDGASGSGSIISAAVNSLRRIFTVAGASPDGRSVTVVEPVSAMVNYVDDMPFPDRRYVVGIGGYNASNNTNVQGIHAEGLYNYGTGRASHTEGANNASTGVAAHTEGIGNYATTTCHAEGLDTRAGYGVFYWDSYDAPSRTFQLFTNSLSTLNNYDVSSLAPNIVLFLITSQAGVPIGSTSTRRNVVRVPVLSADPALNTITAVSAVFADSVTSLGGFTRERQLLAPLTNSCHSEGYQTVARGTGAHAEGVWTQAVGIYSHAAGRQATARHDYSYAWSNGSSSSSTPNFETTRANQYAVSAEGGIYFPGNVGIGTDSIANALTVKGTVSATNIVADNISYTGADFNNLPTYNTYQTNVMVKNANYASVSAEQLNDIGYLNSQGAFALPGSLIIKGHSPDYNTSIQNLPGLGVYGMYIQNVNNMDPGTTFANDGRANSTHAFTFRGGNNNFTGGSDHFHALWQGGPFNPTQSWQVTMGGDSTNSVNNIITNRFMVHTLPQYQISTTITATSGYIDTNQAAITNNNTILSGVKIVVSTQEANNWNLVNVGEVVGLQIVPGLAGLVAATYQSQVYAISSNYVNLSSFEFTVFLGINNNWTPSIKGVQPINLKSRANGGNPGVFQITSQIGSPASNYVGLTGNYKNVPKHILARFTNSNVLSGLKSGAPLTLWIPLNMASSLGTGFVTSSTESSPTNFRYGYFDAFVKSVSGTDLIMSIGNLMDTYGFQHRTWNSTVAGNAGWVLYGGSQDTVHRPTFGTTGFYFEREPWLFTSSNNFAYLSGGMVKNACLGNSESYGNYSYGLGFRGTVLGDKSATLAGDMNYVYGNNSVAVGGEGLVSISGTQVVIGQYNDPNTNALFVAGSGTSDINRKNVYEISTRGDTKQTGFNIKSNACIAAAGGSQATATPVTTDIVAVTGGSGGGVILPVTNGGHHISIQNITGGTISIYAPTGGTLRNIGAPITSPFSFSNEGMVQFFALSANTYAAY
jgi:hypothetical protein